MRATDQSLRDWALAHVEAPVRDDFGLLVESIDPVALKGDPSPERGSVILKLERASLPALRDTLEEAVARHRLVLILASHASGVLLPAEVLDVIDAVDSVVVALERGSSGWGIVLQRADSDTGWRRFAVSEIPKTDELWTRLQQQEREVADLNRQLAIAVDEQRSLIHDLDSAAVRASELEADLRRRLRGVETRRQGLEDELSRVREENERLTRETARLSELEALQNDLERARAELATVRARRDALEARQQLLLGDRARLRHRLALADWKLRRLKSRRWWTLGELLAGLVRSPFAIAAHAATLRRLLRPLRSEPRPVSETNREHRAPDQMEEELVSSGSPHSASIEVVNRPLRSVGSPRQLVVACILDDMSMASFGPECHLTPITPSHWREVLRRQPPDLLLVESAWKGVAGSWEYQVGSYSHPDSIGLPRLTELVDWCRGQGVPTVFWNKEDPVHFEKFKEAARLFDVILTTDGDCIPRYRALGGSRAHTVDVLQFAAQPTLHYPTPLTGRDPRPVFAGTFYRNRHPERRQQLEILLDGALPFDLLIFDRMAGVTTESFGYPERFHPTIVGGIPYEEMVDVYRRHRVFLNTNSVVDSPTMFSRRVFELLACGTPIVSTPSRGMQEMFGDEVATVTSIVEVEKAIRSLLEDDAHWLETSGAGFLTVARHHLYEDRIRAIAEAAGYRFPERRYAHVLGPDPHINNDEWRERNPDTEFVVFGLDERLAWAARVVGADIVGTTSDPTLAYSWSDDLSAGDLAVRRARLEEGWTPTAPLSQHDKVFLVPK